MKSVLELNDIAEGDPKIRAKVAAELVSSWPIPFELGVRKSVMIFYHAMSLPPPHDRFEIYPPNWLVVLDVESGKPITIEKHDPSYYGISSAPNVPFARFKYTHPFEGEQLDNELKKFNATYTKVLKSWFGGADDITEKVLSSFRRDFAWFVPQPTHRIYTYLSPEFSRRCGI